MRRCGTIHEKTPQPTAIIGDVRQREPDERPVADHDSVSTRDWRRPWILAHDDDEDHDVQRGTSRALTRKRSDEAVQPVRGDEAAEHAAEPEAGVGGDARDRGRRGGAASGGTSDASSADWLGSSAPLPTPAATAAMNACRGRVRERQAAVADCERDARRWQPLRVRRHGRSAGPASRRGDDGEPGDGADDEPGVPEAEAAAVVEVDDLEREDGGPAEEFRKIPSETIHNSVGRPRPSRRTIM